MASSIVFTAAAALCLASVVAQTPPPVCNLDFSPTSETWCLKPELNDTIEVPPCLDDGYVETNVDPNASTCAECQSNEELATRRLHWAENVLGCFADPNKPVWHEVNWTCLFEKLGVPFPQVIQTILPNRGKSYIQEGVRKPAPHSPACRRPLRSRRIVIWLPCSAFSDLERSRCSSVAALSHFSHPVRATEPQSQYRARTFFALSRRRQACVVNMNS
jgi:hypothetical protein